MYLQLNSDGSITYPLSLLTFYRSNSGVSFPSSPSDSLLTEFGVYPVTPVAQPDYDAATQAVTESSPVQVNGVWTQQWAVRALTPEELKARVPTIVTMRQARLALLHAGLLSQVEAAIAGIEEAGQRQAVQIEWEYAAEVNREHPWVQALATALGLTEAQLDDLFTLAATL